MRTRYAPTPSGFLHLGNAAHLVLVAHYATARGGAIHLRIDDADADRCRDEFLDDVFDLLEWLDLPWDTGPRSRHDMSRWSQQRRLPHYRHAWQALATAGHVYACTCSRAMWDDYRGDECPGGCRASDTALVVGRTSWRLPVPGHRDPVIWRSNDTPAYHLTSVVDDDASEVDVVIRGMDLIESTLIQQRLSRLMPGSTFHRAQVLHHPLALDESGMKMSKSAGARARPLPRTDEVRGRINALVERFERGLTPLAPRSLGN